jgi:hypothetical protein
MGAGDAGPGIVAEKGPGTGDPGTRDPVRMVPPNT